MEQVRVGIIGIGNMGSSHALTLVQGHIKGAVLAAVCDARDSVREWAEKTLPQDVLFYKEPQEMYQSGSIDAVLVATPHYHHAEQAILAFRHGLHVLIEKPAGVYTKQVREMNEAALGSGKVFSIMYNQRTNPLYIKLKDLISSGELGEVRRTNWIITNWYRSQSYYDSGGWRATWAGEGGGVLINQDPHQLDLWQWTIGMMPKRVRAFCSFGKYRNIEVEDDVTAYVEYENGATGVFVTTTGEAPGTNRFEITGDRGKIVIEDGKMTFWRLRELESEFNKRNTTAFAQPECWKTEIPITGKETGHLGIIQNFIDAIREQKQLIAPGEEGIKGLTLSNAMYLSTWTDQWVDLPIDEDQFYEQLQEKIRSSQIKKSEEQATKELVDLSGTY
ncbi:Gfo/Idh/MocA family oxidoreductase [Paenibacillus sp. Marseille-Q4541]|uniref:Gfo/Idh/MocA family protein n=1 Tax=Paenibacillus sp. Marseille-Q4541 TaxID=2831522 RepID=UPI001BAB6E51|nr:Gfo/Idh/MocA family oxidoreductase [Paenibacillus sp. Marseille-Q4541]